MTNTVARLWQASWWNLTSWSEGRLDGSFTWVVWILIRQSAKCLFRHYALESTPSFHEVPSYDTRLFYSIKRHNGQIAWFQVSLKIVTTYCQILFESFVNKPEHSICWILKLELKYSIFSIIFCMMPHLQVDRMRAWRQDLLLQPKQWLLPGRRYHLEIPAGHVQVRCSVPKPKKALMLSMTRRTGALCPTLVSAAMRTAHDVHLYHKLYYNLVRFSFWGELKSGKRHHAILQ